MTRYFGFGGRLHHEVPPWVDPDTVFHIRIRCAADNTVLITSPKLAERILESVRFYQARRVWHPAVSLLMPDHLHALLAFSREKIMSRVISSWKHYHTAKNGIRWQDGYFDHRLRNEEQFELKYRYILNNPVAKGLCVKAEDWSWWIGCCMRDGKTERT